MSRYLYRIVIFKNKNKIEKSKNLEFDKFLKEKLKNY